MANSHGRPGCPQGAPRPRRRALVLVALFLQVALLGALAATASDPVMPSGEWTRDLADLEDPYRQATAITAMVLSQNGATLVVGTDNGGVLFLNTTTGEVLDAAETAAHGAVQRIVLDRSGTLAAIVYEDGYVAAISTAARDPLLTLLPKENLPPEERAAIAAVPSHDGRYLVVTGDPVRLFHRGSAPEARFQEVATDPGLQGPHVWFHRVLRVLGVLSPDGAVTLYTYSADGMRAAGERDITDTSERILALAVSGDANRFAVALENGVVTRYTPSLNPENPQLIPDFVGNADGRVLGIALDHDGQRLAAWSARELLWIDGCNRNIELCDGKTTERDTVRLRAPGFGTTFGAAAVTPDLSRAVVQVEGNSLERRLYNLPSLDHFVMRSDAGTSGVALVSPSGTTVYVADGKALTARAISPAELAPPEVRESGAPSGTGGGDAHLLGVSTQVFLIAGIGALALLLLVVLGSVFLAMRRGAASPAPPLPSLVPASETPFSTLAAPMGGGGVRPGQVRPVAPSAPPTGPPPEGHLVLQQLAPTAGRPLPPLDLAVRRPEVLRVQGARRPLDAFATLLGGRVPFRGTLAVGGASARDTPTLYERRVRVGLGAAHARRDDAAALFREAAAARGLPLGLVERRMQKDLGWMGDRLHRPVADLRPLDRWKVLLALALVDRPHLLVLDAKDLPWNGGGTERTDTLRRVLAGIARHYETLVVLLDDGSMVQEGVRRVADEEVRLGADGFTDRALLKDGRPVAAARRPAETGRRRR